MDTKVNFAAQADNRIVYVRPIKADELPNEIRAKIGGEGTLYAVHDGEGQQLALVRNRHLAFMLARQNDLSPVPVH